MTMINCFHMYPNPFCIPTTAGNSSMDATGERIGQVFQIMKAGNISKVVFYLGTTGTGDTLRVSLQSVNMTTGLPSGTILGATNNGYADVVINAADDGVWKTATLGESVAVTQGQWIALVFSWTSYVAGSINIYYNYSSLITFNYNTYYITDITATPGTWSKALTNACTAACFEYDDASYYFNFIPACLPGIGGHTISSSTTPDEVGNYFQVPAKMRACGLWVFGDFDYDTPLSLLDASNNVLANCSMDPDCRHNNSYNFHYVFFDSDPAAQVTLNKDTWYRMIITPGASSVYARYADVPSAAAMGGLEGGTLMYATTRTDGGAWSDSTTRRYSMGLLIDQMDDGAGSGGGLITHPGMAGGCHG